jgi:hypothetical protein
MISASNRHAMNNARQGERQPRTLAMAAAMADSVQVPETVLPTKLYAMPGSSSMSVRKVLLCNEKDGVVICGEDADLADSCKAMR